MNAGAEGPQTTPTTSCSSNRMEEENSNIFLPAPPNLSSNYRVNVITYWYIKIERACAWGRGCWNEILTSCEKEKGEKKIKLFFF